MMQCSITWRAAGPCRVCGCQLNGPGADMRAAHLTDDGVVCAAHCPVHREAEHLEAAGDPATVQGDQVELFA